jgi:polyhydroxyalkanoate synthesis repressor PhaR
MDKERIIKKYPNRRLYDTAISRYVTLADVRDLVRSNVRFRVIDVKTDDDITRTILLQIILEEEDKGTPIFSADLLEKIICSYGDAMQGFLSSYLQQSVEVFLNQQRLLNEQMAGLMTNGPLSVFSELARQNAQLWQEFQKTSAKPFGFTPPRESKKES